MHASATITLKVTLSAGGYVESVAIYQADSSVTEIAKQEFEDEAILSAARTTYAPERIDCKPVSGTYIFKVGFR
jgi:hypothetical protein